MRRMVVGQAGSELDAVIEAARTEPVELVQPGVGAAIILSPAAFQSLIGPARSAPRPELEPLMRQSIDEHGKIYRALAAWEAKHEPPDRNSE